MLSYQDLFEAPDELALFDAPPAREDGGMTEEDIIAHVAALPGVVADTPDETSDAPEIAWGDTFVFYDPDDKAANRMMPFATIVTKDYPGFDTESRLDRPGVFRLNISVGREAFADLIGHAPADHAQHHARFDYAAADQVLPHPAYAIQSWVSIVNPGTETEALAKELLTAAHTRAVRRHRPRTDTTPD